MNVTHKDAFGVFKNYTVVQRSRIMQVSVFRAIELSIGPLPVIATRRHDNDCCSKINCTSECC